MAERVLCDDGLRVTMDGGGERTLIVAGDGGTIRFWAETCTMEEILTGGRVQLSAHGSYCAFEVGGDRTSLEFGLDGEGRKRCTFPTQDLASALAWVRSLPTPGGNEIQAGL